MPTFPLLAEFSRFLHIPAIPGGNHEIPLLQNHKNSTIWSPSIKLKVRQNQWSAVGAYYAPPDPLVGWGGDTLSILLLVASGTSISRRHKRLRLIPLSRYHPRKDLPVSCVEWDVKP